MNVNSYYSVVLQFDKNSGGDYILDYISRSSLPIQVIMKKIRVLVADDHILVREGLSRLLEKEKDIDCVALAQDGEEVIKLAEELLPDVAIVDVSMPKMNGIQALRELKRVSPNTAILMLSAYKYDHYVATCIEAGADGYLLKKNLPSDGIAAAIRMLHGGGAVYDREATTAVMRRIAGKDKTGAGPVELGNREVAVLKLALDGKTNKEIAHELGISSLTVGTHFVNIFRKLGVESRMEAVVYALKKGLISIDELSSEHEI